MGVDREKLSNIKQFVLLSENVSQPGEQQTQLGGNDGFEKLFYFSMGEDFLDYILVSNIILFINVIICLSYPVNFAIYCGMSR